MMVKNLSSRSKKNFALIVLSISCFSAWADDPRKSFFGFQYLYNRTSLFTPGALDWEAPLNLPGQLHAVGLGWVAPLSNSNTNTQHWESQFNFSLVLPGIAYLPDGTKGRYQGYSIQLLMFGWDFLSHYRKSDLAVYLGLETGRLRMKGEGFDLRNPQFSPTVLLSYKKSVGRLILGLQVSAGYDISSSKWKALHFGRKDSRDIPHTNQSSAQFGFSIMFH